jgi:hypothetical protein
MFLHRNIDPSQGWIEHFDSYILTFLDLTFENYLETFERWTFFSFKNKWINKYIPIFYHKKGV